MPDGSLQKPEDRLLVFIYDDLRALRGTVEDVRATVEGHGLEIQALEQTLNGPAGSQNGLYRTVKKIESDVAKISADVAALSTFRESVLAEAKEDARLEREEAQREENVQQAKLGRNTRLNASLIAAGAVVLAKILEKPLELLYQFIFH